MRYIDLQGEIVSSAFLYNVNKIKCVIFHKQCISSTIKMKLFPDVSYFVSFCINDGLKKRQS